MALARPLSISLATAGLLVGLAGPAAAQDESSPSIDLGSSRIGGPGLTDRERKWVKSWDEPEEYLTEETLPKPGDYGVGVFFMPRDEDGFKVIVDLFEKTIPGSGVE